MGQYHDLYLKSDILQLSCVFEAFRNECKENYTLEPAHFYTSPGLSWSAALKMSKCRLQLITEDISNAYVFIEEGIRGGVSQISHQSATANNTYLSESYDPSEESSFIIDLDCNNIYGYVMSMSLPVGDFKFLNKEKCNSFDPMTIPPNGDKGYILEVDFEYPDSLHDLHSDFPLAPETKPISDEMLSPYSRDIWLKLN